MYKSLILPVILLALLVSGCGALFPAPVPTALPPEMIGTEIVLTQAAIAAETVTNAPSPTITPHPSRTSRPSETPRPTWTPSTTPSPTVTFVISIPTMISSGPGIAPTILVTYPWSPLPGYEAANGCDLIALSPKWNKSFLTGTKFNAKWTFANYGPYTWNEGEVDFLFKSGEHMHTTGNVLDIPKTVMPDGSVEFMVPMIAPTKTGTFTSVWLLHQGDRFYCQVSVQIQSVAP